MRRNEQQWYLGMCGQGMCSCSSAGHVLAAARLARLRAGV